MKKILIGISLILLIAFSIFWIRISSLEKSIANQAGEFNWNGFKPKIEAVSISFLNGHVSVSNIELSHSKTNYALLIDEAELEAGFMNTLRLILFGLEKVSKYGEGIRINIDKSYFRSERVLQPLFNSLTIAINGDFREFLIALEQNRLPGQILQYKLRADQVYDFSSIFEDGEIESNNSLLFHRLLIDGLFNPNLLIGSNQIIIQPNDDSNNSGRIDFASKYQNDDIYFNPEHIEANIQYKGKLPIKLPFWGGENSRIKTDFIDINIKANINGLEKLNSISGTLKAEKLAWSTPKKWIKDLAPLSFFIKSEQVLPIESVEVSIDADDENILIQNGLIKTKILHANSNIQLDVVEDDIIINAGSTYIDFKSVETAKLFFNLRRFIGKPSSKRTYSPSVDILWSGSIKKPRFSIEE